MQLSLVGAPESGPVVSSSQFGAISEHAAVVRLLSLGRRVAVPVCDEGVDLVVDYRWRVQVKATAVVSRSAAVRPHAPRFDFNVTKTRGVDVFLFHHQPSDVWWVARACDVRPSARKVHISCGGRAEWRDDWGLFDRLGGSDEFVDLRDLCVAV